MQEPGAPQCDRHGACWTYTPGDTGQDTPGTHIGTPGPVLAPRPALHTLPALHNQESLSPEPSGHGRGPRSPRPPSLLSPALCAPRDRQPPGTPPAMQLPVCGCPARHRPGSPTARGAAPLERGTPLKCALRAHAGSQSRLRHKLPESHAGAMQARGGQRAGWCTRRDPLAFSAAITESRPRHVPMTTAKSRSGDGRGLRAAESTRVFCRTPCDTHLDGELATETLMELPTLLGHLGQEGHRGRWAAPSRHCRTLSPALSLGSLPLQQLPAPRTAELNPRSPDRERPVPRLPLPPNPEPLGVALHTRGSWARGGPSGSCSFGWHLCRPPVKTPGWGSQAQPSMPRSTLGRIEKGQHPGQG